MYGLDERNVEYREIEGEMDGNLGGQFWERDLDIYPAKVILYYSRAKTNILHDWIKMDQNHHMSIPHLY